jgi:hypothetical protein
MARLRTGAPPPAMSAFLRSCSRVRITSGGCVASVAKPPVAQSKAKKSSRMSGGASQRSMVGMRLSEPRACERAGQEAEGGRCVVLVHRAAQAREAAERGHRAHAQLSAACMRMPHMLPCALLPWGTHSSRYMPE